MLKSKCLTSQDVKNKVAWLASKVPEEAVCFVDLVAVPVASCCSPDCVILTFIFNFREKNQCWNFYLKLFVFLYLKSNVMPTVVSIQCQKHRQTHLCCSTISKFIE